MSYPTPHIHATPDDIAPVVLMPGDPLRARYIAETFFDAPVLFNNVRGVQGYTGIWQGVRVSVMASGMGMPSIGIYSYELYRFFGVETIIRVGSAGAMQPHIGLRELVLGMGACTDSSYANQFGLGGTFAPIADYSLLRGAADVAKNMNIPCHVGNLLSSDAFYGDILQAENTRRWAGMGVLAVEMEAAALYMNAARAGKRALTVCTISDHLLTGEALDAVARQTTFNDMIEVALRAST